MTSVSSPIVPGDVICFKSKMSTDQGLQHLYATPGFDATCVVDSNAALFVIAVIDVKNSYIENVVRHDNERFFYVFVMSGHVEDGQMGWMTARRGVKMWGAGDRH